MKETGKEDPLMMPEEDVVKDILAGLLVKEDSNKPRATNIIQQLIYKSREFIDNVVQLTTTDSDFELFRFFIKQMRDCN